MSKREGNIGELRMSDPTVGGGGWRGVLTHSPLTHTHTSSSHNVSQSPSQSRELKRCYCTKKPTHSLAHSLPRFIFHSLLLLLFFPLFLAPSTLLKALCNSNQLSLLRPFIISIFLSPSWLLITLLQVYLLCN